MMSEFGKDPNAGLMDTTRGVHSSHHRPTERSDPTQHAKGRTGDCPGPRKEAATRRDVTQGGHRVLGPVELPAPCRAGISDSLCACSCVPHLAENLLWWKVM